MAAISSQISIIVYTPVWVVWRWPVHGRPSAPYRLLRRSRERDSWLPVSVSCGSSRRRDCNCRPGSCSRRSHRRPGNSLRSSSSLVSLFSLLSLLFLSWKDVVGLLPQSMSPCFQVLMHLPVPLLMRCSSGRSVSVSSFTSCICCGDSFCRSFIEFLVEHYSGKGTMECEMRNGRSPAMLLFLPVFLR